MTTPSSPVTSEVSTVAGASTARFAPGGGGFRVDPLELRIAARCVDAEAEALADAGATLDARLASLQGCWGDDVVGRRFAAAYTPAATTVVGNLHALAWGLVRIGAALRASADSYERADQEAALAAADALAALAARVVA